MVLGDDDVVEGEDRLGVHPDPGHLVVLADLDVTEQTGRPAHSHRAVGGRGEEVRLTCEDTFSTISQSVSQSVTVAASLPTSSVRRMSSSSHGYSSYQ